MKIIITKDAEFDLLKHKKAGQKKLINKISELVVDISKTPRKGIGKPEQLKHKENETWSRKIDDKHRIVYEISENEILILSFWGHYSDK
jgi:toxin YoeB